MKSRINDERYNKYLLEREYDKIICSCANMIIENAARDKKKRIIIRDTNSPSFPCILQIARAALDISSGLSQNIYIQCKLKDYFKIKKKYEKFGLKWIRGTHLCATGEKPLLDMISKWHKMNDEKIFEKIYDSFYNIEKIGKEEAINEDS